MGIFNLASFFLVLVFLSGTASFVAYLIFKRNGRKWIAAFAVGVGVLCFTTYLLSLIGVLSNPLPGDIGRLVAVSLALIFGLLAVAIWKW